LAEASNPVDAWRLLAFNDTGWSNASAPFFYGDPYSNGLSGFTLLSDMLGGSYSSVYLRKKFTLSNAAAVTNLNFVHQSDDGFIAWINGTEVIRYNMGAGQIAYNGSAPTAVSEPNNTGAAYISVNLANVGSYLLDGTNELAVHAFNNAPTTSSDFGFNAQIWTYLADDSTVAPRIASATPPPGEVFALSNLTVRFTEPVSGVDFASFLINGNPASSVTSTTNTTYTSPPTVP
jgi:hypothetical protein